MASGFDDDELALSIAPTHVRRNSARAADDQPPSALPPVLSRNVSSQQSSTQSLEERMSQYKFIKTLGEGSFGKVKLAVHKVTGQKVALKIINRRKLQARDMQGRIEREIQYLQLLRHPHIIKLYTVITTDNEIVMVLEYAGGELFNYIVEHGKLPEDRARQFFQQIVCAVEYCHRHKIVHRDLKPENLLLDENLHVKIADFGLSNIMTDGNFLKTSCGSPNYAAPEVISGKLYAGPEVDVWSCGVILFVLLVGRLPFDDEYIPALFKKIASGQYHIPHSVPSGAARLIKKMLQVSPVSRITIQEIRQDAWFNKHLPDYLQQPVAEFLDTGVDPTKAIDPKRLAPTKSAAVVEKLHNEVVDKLGKRMGYGRDDVQQALAIDEPNAIKDAYLIVRENQMMKDTAAAANDPALQPFLAQSPPVPSPMTRLGGLSTPQPLSLNAPDPSQPLPDRSRQGSTAGVEPRPYISTIGILPDSLPEFHEARMRGEAPPSESGEVTEQALDDQVATAARLNPHRRAVAGQDRSTRPEGMTPLQPVAKKSKTTKWQFGIRSRNAPSEAMLAIFKALRKMGAEWEVANIRDPGGYREEESASPEGDESGISSSDDDDREGTRSGRRRSSGGRSVSSTSRGRHRSQQRQRGRYGSWNDWGLAVPADPWVINARFKKDGMFAPGILHTASANSSRVDLNVEANLAGLASSSDAAANRRRSSTMSSTTSIGGTAQPSSADNASLAGPGVSSLSLGHYASANASGRNLTTQNPVADDTAYIYLTIQLYSIEKEFYLVDFKCAGYERLVRRLIREVETHDEALSDDNDDTDSDRERNHPPKDIATGKPRDGGAWDTLRKMSSHSNRKPVRPQRHDSDSSIDDDDDADSEGGTKSGIKLREELVGDGRAVDEKDVSSPFPFLDVASRLIIQLAEAD